MADHRDAYRFSQDIELVLPQKQKAYPISLEEWGFLKKKVSSIRDTANVFHTIGSILLGIAGSAGLSLLTTERADPMTVSYIISFVVTAGIGAATLLSGLCFIVFGSKQRKVQNTSGHEVLEHMNLIEHRYDLSKSEEGIGSKVRGTEEKP